MASRLLYSANSEPSSLPILLLFCIVTVLALVPLYLSEDPLISIAAQAFGWLTSSSLVMLPLLLFLALQLLTLSSRAFYDSGSSQRGSWARPAAKFGRHLQLLDGSSLGVALILCIALILISWHTTIQESWHPFLRWLSGDSTRGRSHFRKRHP